MVEGDVMPGPRIMNVVKYTGNERSFSQKFSDSYATAMICAPDNTIWISSLQPRDNYGSSIGGGLVNFTDNGYVHYTTDNDLPAGAHRTVWDGTDENGLAAASGIYFARIVSGNHTATCKMLLMK